ncbi:MAG: glycine cleavage system protein R [Acidimicrobiales bacterium]
MDRVAVTAVGADRPGIVAAVSRVFVEWGCNLEDSSMTILRGQFAMMLVVDVPAGVTAPDLEAALAPAAAALDLVVAVRPLRSEQSAAGVPGTPGAPHAGGGASRWTVSVHGADRPGIVHRVAELLAGEGVNIVDLSTRVIGRADRPGYAMVLEVVLPPGADAAALVSRLESVAAELGVDATMHAADADIL